VTKRQQHFRPVSSYVDFSQREKQIVDDWYSSGLVKKYLQKNDKEENTFSFLDGPITANNPMGVHHAWGRTYKDLWQRYFTMRGLKQRYQNGFDCQGLWVEVEVEKELGVKNKKEIEDLVSGNKKASIKKFVQMCKERVLKFSQIQTEQSRRLGYFMDWDNSYFTMSDENNYMIWHFLKTCHENGWIYKGRDSVPWCPRCETAISQHEMLTEDYKELTHETVFFKLHIVTEAWKGTSLLVWTTTPWTVPANVAVGVNTSYLYGVWKNKEKDEQIIILHKDGTGEKPTRQKGKKTVSLPEYVFGNDSDKYEFVRELPGKQLIGLTYKGPFDDLPIVQEAKKEKPSTFHTVIDGSDVVVSTEGTGLLHVAPGAGQEDFALGKEYDLPIIQVIKDDASYVEGMSDLSGLNAKKKPYEIIKRLQDKDEGEYLLKTMSFTHRYPACWRCKDELVWKVTDEWYIAMDKVSTKSKNQSSNAKMSKKTLRQQMIVVAKQISWMPSFGLERELDWLNNMHDWLISKKNRYWGLALPIWECESCGNFEIIGSKGELQKRAIEGWDTFEGQSPHKPQIDDIRIRCTKCGERISRIEPVGNPWLDAGIVPFSTIARNNVGEPLYTNDKKNWKQWFPADFITESFPGQFKNWFYALIAMSTVLEGKPPTKRILGFGTLLGEDGRPMHKSWGNAIEFNEGAEKIGADVMRWMYARHNPERNLLFGYKVADITRRTFHLTLWNTYNFFVTYANLASMELKYEDKLTHHNFSNPLDTWILARLFQVISQTTGHLDEYNVNLAAESIDGFVQDFSLWYVRRSRDRVGIMNADKRDKKQCLWTMWFVLKEISKLLVPFTPFLSDEIHKNLIGTSSILADWPEVKHLTTEQKAVISDMEEVRKIVETGHSVRQQHNIKTRQPLSSATICSPHEFKQYENLIMDELNVKRIIWEKKKEIHVTYKTELTEELLEEGEMRETIRQIQRLRKQAACGLEEKVVVSIPHKNLKKFEDKIKQRTLAKKILWGKELQVTRS
jgi:isoleucyl-tRNA synthetase